MNSSKLKIVLTYSILGAGLAAAMLLWRARQKMDLFSVPETKLSPAISVEPPLRLKPSAAETKAELARTVQGQLDAFRANDYDKAFRFAVKGIQASFTLSDFEQMVKRDYTVIAEWKSVRYGLSLDNSSAGVLQVFIQGDDKLEIEFQYTLEKEEGTWKVVGVKGIVPNPATPGGRL